MSGMNIQVLSVSKLVEILAKLYVSVIKNGTSLKSIPSAFLWGPPGVGKSESIKELADILEKETGKKVMVRDIRLLLFSPVDLRGVPVADESKSFTDWLMPRIFDLNPGPDVINLIFLDELSSAPPSIQAAAYQITLDHMVGEHELPENTIILAAGNRTSDRSVVYRMPAALANRLMHFEVGIDFDSWAKWAIEYGEVHPLVLGYLSYDVSKLYCEGEGKDIVAFPTPRSWMFVSNILKVFGDNADMDQCYSLICSCIGSGTAIEFIAWCRTKGELPKVEDIIKGYDVKRPKTQDAVYALMASLSAYVLNREKNTEYGMSISELDNMCNYCRPFPIDYLTSLYSSLMREERLCLKLMKVEAFKEWRARNKSR